VGNQRALITRDQSRRLDQRAISEFGIPSVVLMENAGRGVADRLCELGIDGPVAIVCGKGNNGGDGFVVARHLDLRGYPVRILMACDEDELSVDAATNLRIARRAGLEIVDLRSDPTGESLTACLDQVAWIVDAILGTGARGDPRPPWGKVILSLNRAPCERMAVDIPSGLDCDSGQLGKPTFQADHTCTFVACKPGLLDEGARGHVGLIHIVDIGAPRKLVEATVSAT